MEDDALKWINTEYHSFLSEAVSASLQYLHSTITWSITITSAGVGFILAQKTFPDPKSYLFSLALLVIISHFFVRSGKAYINVIRYAAIQRYIISKKLDCKANLCSPDNFESLKYYIKRYHLEWSCPLKRTTVLTKLLTEFGFLYFFIFNFGLLGYIISKIQHSNTTIAIGLLAIIACYLEIYCGLLLSPYMRDIEVDKLAEKFK